MAFNISSPSSKKDLITKEVERAKNSKKLISWNYSTWEFNPEISKRDLADEFNADYITAMRDFGAVPPNSSYPYISDIKHILGIVESTRRNTVRFTPQIIQSYGGKEMGSGKIRFISGKDNNKRIMAIDGAYVKNSFAIICGYFDDVLQRPIFDTFVEIPGSSDAPLNFNSIFEDIIKPMIEHLNVKIMVADRFQSKKFLDDVSNIYDIPAEIYSVKYGDFEAFRTDLLDNAVTIPKPEIKLQEFKELDVDNYPQCFLKAPVAHFLYQIITVQDMRKEVLKGEGLEDDLFRAAVLAYSYMVDPKYQEYCSGSQSSVVAKIPYFAGTVASRGNSQSFTTNRAGTSSNATIFAAIASRGN